MIVQDVFGRTIRITPNTWCPAVWAGSEGLVITINDAPYRILRVDLDKRVITLDITNGIKSNDKIQCKSNGIYK